MGQSPTNFYYTDSDYDVTAERLWCDATALFIFSLSKPTETKNFPIFYSFLSIQMLPYIIFLCKFVQLVDRYFSLVLRGRPVTTTTATWNCYKELGISNVIGNLHKNAWHGNWGQYNIRHDLINVV